MYSSSARRPTLRPLRRARGRRHGSRAPRSAVRTARSGRTAAGARAPGWSATSATISETSPGSNSAPTRVGRIDDGPFELVGGQRRTLTVELLDEPTERPVAQRPVLEVGPHGQHHPQSGSGPRSRRAPGRRGSGRRLVVLGQGEQLLELVDHQEHSRRRRRGPWPDHRGRCLDDRRPARPSESGGAGWPPAARPPPAPRTGSARAAWWPRTTGPSRAPRPAAAPAAARPGPPRLPDPRRTDHRRDAASVPVRLSSSTSWSTSRSRPGEVGGVGLGEGPQPLVGVAGLGRPTRRAAPDPRRLPTGRPSSAARNGGDELLDRREAVGRVLGRRPGQDLVDRSRQVGAHDRGPSGIGSCS